MTADLYRKQVFSVDLKLGDAVDEVFCVSRSERRSGRRGLFLRLEFLDRSGRIAGVAWDRPEELAAILVEGDFVRIRGRVGEYQGRPQVEVLGAEAVREPLERGEYLPTGPVPGEESVAAIRRIADSLRDIHLAGLVRAFLDDPEFSPAFAAAPAAKLHHHAYVGGLAEHTRSVMELCLLATDHYPELDRDLLLAGAFCHDIGKTLELSIEPGFPYTEEGTLIGHIPLGFRMVGERIRSLADFPADRATDLGHLVLSHQGELEWGSPVEPQTLEAIVLHFIDNLDSKIASARIHLSEVESGRTGYVKSLGRSLFRRGPVAPASESEGRPPPFVTGGGPEDLLPPTLFDGVD